MPLCNLGTIYQFLNTHFEKSDILLTHMRKLSYARLTLAQNLLYPILKANGKSWSQMKLTLAKVLAKKYQQVVLYLTLCPLCLLITFANSLDPDQAPQNVGA